MGRASEFFISLTPKTIKPKKSHLCVRAFLVSPRSSGRRRRTAQQATPSLRLQGVDIADQCDDQAPHIRLSVFGVNTKPSG